MKTGLLFADGELFAAGPFLFGGLTLGGVIQIFFIPLLGTAAAAIPPSRPLVAAAALRSLLSSLCASLPASFLPLSLSYRELMVAAGSAICQNLQISELQIL